MQYVYETATCVDGAGNHFDRVLLLQYIEGYQLAAIPPDDKTLVISLLYPASEKISKFDVIHGDPQPEQRHLCSGLLGNYLQSSAMGRLGASYLGVPWPLCGLPYSNAG